MSEKAKSVFRPMSHRVVMIDPKKFNERPVQWFEGSIENAERSACEALKTASVEASAQIYVTEEKLIKTITHQEVVAEV